MKTEYKRKWIEALRSGEYRQAEGYLTKLDKDGNPIGHCCLGVLTELVSDEVPLSIAVETSHFKGGVVRSYSASVSLLPEKVADHVGLSDISIVYSFEVGEDRIETLALTELNDEGFTFDQIADVIEWAEPDE